jgi:hypothetical protein
MVVLLSSGAHQAQGDGIFPKFGFCCAEMQRCPNSMLAKMGITPTWDTPQLWIFASRFSIEAIDVNLRQFGCQ